MEDDREYNVITISCPDVNGEINIRNNGYRDKFVSVIYEIKTEDEKDKVRKGKKCFFVCGYDDKKIDIYKICNVDRKEIILLNVYIQEYSVLSEIQPYIVLAFVITLIIMITLYIYIRVNKRRIGE